MNNLKGLDAIFGTAKEVEKEIMEINISSLVDYRKGNLGKNRYSKEDMNDLTESIKNFGVIQPLIVRPIPDTKKYEILLGHHRKDAAKRNKLPTVPCIVKELDDDEAESFFLDSNLQKGVEKLTHSEKAELIYRRNEVLKNQGVRTDLMSNEEKENRENINEEFHLSSSTIKRYLRIYKLTDIWKQMLDRGSIAIRTAVNISYLDTKEQEMLYDLVEEKGLSISENESISIKENKKLGNITRELLIKILCPIVNEEPMKKQTKKKTIYRMNSVVFSKFFTEEQEMDEIEDIVEKALEEYFSRN